MIELFALYMVVAVPVGLAVFGHLRGSEIHWHMLDILVWSIIAGLLWPVTFMLVGNDD